LTAAYGRVTAIWDVAFDIPAGGIVTLLGSNGAGKTTTLRTMTGLLPASGGQVLFEGRDVTHAASDQLVELGIIHVPEGRQLWAAMTVEENLQLGAYVARAKAQRARSLERVYELFPRLRERRQQAAGTLSGGERQMCALGRGLMGMPRLLLLDEPSLGLAPRLVSETFRTIGRLREAGITVLLVEQNMRQALALADYGYVLETGRVVFEGTSSALLADPHVQAAYLGVAA
jgi:branched-chain amino acid transport system ATP-binding protein